MLENFISNLNDALYSYILIILLVLGGLFFTIKTKFVQFRLFKEQIKAVTEKPSGTDFTDMYDGRCISTGV